MRSSALLAGQCIFCNFRRSIWSSTARQSLAQHGAQPRRSTPVSATTGLQAQGLRYRSQQINLRPRSSKDALRQRSGRVQDKQTKGRPTSLAQSQNIFESINTGLASMRKRLNDRLFRIQTGLQDQDAAEIFDQYESAVRHSLSGPSAASRFPRFLEDAQRAQDAAGSEGVDRYVKYTLQDFVANELVSEQDKATHRKMSDLRYPYEWYPAARSMQRKLHLHIGPTNSGKTYHALQRLEAAKYGIYAGPLRLLAFEVYHRLNAKGKLCNLVTGDEVRYAENPDGGKVNMNSCTVEMVDYGDKFDVAVIDEIQMIGRDDRGWAWTKALLGLRAKEIHMCGEERALPLIQEIAAALGEELIVHRYQRLSPLACADRSLRGSLKHLKKGDCVVSFSRRGIHALKLDIEKMMRRRVAVVYGALPPEVRAQQAQLFNDENNEYDILVASDAIGMGLNLSIKRLIFESTQKYDGASWIQLKIPDIKQIAGRAGRYRTAAQATEPDIKQSESNDAEIQSDSPTLGIVTTLEDIDLPILQKAMDSSPEPLRSAGLNPPDSLILRFASYFPPQTPLSYILLRLHEISRMHWRFHLCELREQLLIADAIQEVDGLSIADRLVFCAAPAPRTDNGLHSVVAALARCVAQQSGGNLLDIPEIDLDILDLEGPMDTQKLRSLEFAHKALVLYLWLSYRFSHIFTSQALAFHAKELLQARIDKVLGQESSSQTRARRRRAMLAARKAAQRAESLEQVSSAGNDPDAGAEIVGDEQGEEPLSEVSAEGAGPSNAEGLGQFDEQSNDQGPGGHSTGASTNSLDGTPPSSGDLGNHLEPPLSPREHDAPHP